MDFSLVITDEAEWAGLFNRIRLVNHDNLSSFELRTRTASRAILSLGNGARLSALSVSDEGAVLWLTWANFHMLLPMGMDVNALDDLQQNSAMSNISALLLAESGYAPVNPPGLIGQLNPQVAVLSVASADKTGLPSPETIQSLRGYNLLRTDNNGCIQVTTDGKQMWVEVEMK
jgi:hypothetical protein